MTVQPFMQNYIELANANLQAFESLADIAFNTSERLLALNGDAARSLCEFASANAQPLVGEDLRDQFNDRVSVQGQGVEQMTAYVRNINDLYLQLQSEVAELNARRLADFSQAMISALDALASNSPAGGADFVAAMKSTLNTANRAYENLIKVSREVTESNWTAASRALQPAATAAASNANAKASRKAA